MAWVTSAKASLGRLEQLKAFSKITAPFDGVVTARSTDVGALIDSGSNAKELFHVAAVNRLRVFVNVPEIYSRAAQTGMKADLTLTEFPGRSFTGTLARTAQSIRQLVAAAGHSPTVMGSPPRTMVPGGHHQVMASTSSRPALTAGSALASSLARPADPAASQVCGRRTGHRRLAASRARGLMGACIG